MRCGTLRRVGAHLERWYPGSVRRAGRTHPAVVQPLAGGCADVLEVVPGLVPLDEELLALGAPHLAAVRRRSPRMHDGGVLALLAVADGAVRVAASGYFAMVATCDAVRAELETADPVPHDLRALVLRARAHELAGGDPLASGAGRAAALGVSLVVTLPPSAAGPTGPAREGRALVVGRRSDRVATDRGRWHVVPSGMLEGTDGAGGALAATAAGELAEELGIVVAPDELAARATVLGLAHDTTRLRPDLCLRLDLTRGEAAAAAFDVTGEFDAYDRVGLGAADLARFWAAHPPELLTPAAAGALALLEASLAGQGGGAGRRVGR